MQHLIHANTVCSDRGREVDRILWKTLPFSGKKVNKNQTLMDSRIFGGTHYEWHDQDESQRFDEEQMKRPHSASM